MKIRPTTRTIGALCGALLLVVMTASLALATPIKQPTVSISPNSAPAGATVTVNGNNFTPGTSIVIGYTTGDCTTNVTAIAGATGTAAADGSVNISFTWPATDPGSYYICATDPSTHNSTRSNGPIQVVVPPTLTVSAPVYSGQPVTVTGAHFAPSTANGGSSVEVTYGG
ncbi:MAG TPA: IPT/TIG domain-containing protein, partial [Ktedonobacterales bacterium]|nr:IPT/TIG domain-containing protein [Ktedonobacterales bacterium]